VQRRPSLYQKSRKVKKSINEVVSGREERGIRDRDLSISGKNFREKGFQIIGLFQCVRINVL
jgi:hypothetical protein